MSKTAPAFTIKDLLKLIEQGNARADLALIEKAYHFAEKAHGPQKRDSGELYIHHPLAVARILAEYKLDTASIATGLLHDTVEDTGVELSQIEAAFGSEIASLVDGVSKLSKMNFQTAEEKQAENFRKMIFAMAKDLRVILVKLADRLHNMRTLSHVRPDKQQRIAAETLDIYSPLANRLGLSSLKRELEDLSLRYSKPDIYYKLVEYVAKKMKEREEYTHDVQAMIQAALTEHGYLDAQVSGRPKHFFSIHKKMEKRNLTFEQINDVTGFRIVVSTVDQCYGILGLVHALWTPVPGRFKDYIAIPKANLYQSLHTTVIGPQGERIEIQIRTKEMHDTAERGIAAHWAYKEGGANPKDLEKFKWLNRLVEWNRDVTDPNEFLETVKLDLFAEEVFVFTPKGQVMEFPQGATPLDFAYAVHTEVGHHCIGAKINGRMVPLKHKLKSGDTLEIVTSPNQRPNKDWLKLVKTSRAKNKIRQFIKVEEHERSKVTGQMLLERELARHGMQFNALLKDGTLKKAAEYFAFNEVEDFIVGIGYGKISAKKAVTKIIPKGEPKEKESEGPLQQIVEEARRKSTGGQAVRVKGVEDLLVRFARCCTPVPGDPVVGFITRGRGISVHSKKCPKIFESDPHRLVDIEWDLSKKAERKVKIRVLSQDRPGLLADMSQAIRDHNVNITNAQIGTTKDKQALCIFSVTITDLQELRKILNTLETIDGVISAERVQKKES